MLVKCQTRFSVCKEIWKRTTDIHWPWFREKVVLDQGRQSTRNLDCLEVDSKSKSHGKLSIHYAVALETIETIFRIIVPANQLSLYGAVSAMCEEYESLHEKTGQPVVKGESSSSLVLSVIKTETLWIVMTWLTKIFYCKTVWRTN